MTKNRVEGRSRRRIGRIEEAYEKKNKTNNREKGKRN
jgi:hypothetical protein